MVVIMKNLKKELLLGVNPTTNEIILGEFEITTRNNYKEFTASFDVGEAFDIDAVDLNEQCQLQWDCLDDNTRLNLLLDGDRTRKDVFEEWTRYSDYREFVDCSCTDIETELENGTIINFETTSCGQHDIREDKNNYNNIIFTNKEAVEKLLKLWDLYHLKNIEKNISDIEKDINFIIEKIGDFTRYSNKTQNFIKSNIFKN